MKVSLALAALLSFATAAHASPMRSIAKVMQSLSTGKAKALLPNCTDYTGTWVGSCANSDGSTDDNQTTVIKQSDCAALVIDGYNFVIGGVNRAGSTSFLDNSNFDWTLNYSWNASRTKLAGPISVAVNWDSFGNMATVGLSSMALEDGKLHTIDHFVGSATTSTNFPGFVSTDCVYTKSP